MPLPPREVDLDENIVRRLIAAQCPDLARCACRFASEGWDFAMFRLGVDLAVRLPRVRAAADLLMKEREWVPRVAGDLGVTVPRHLRNGLPSADFDMPWAIVPWISGSTADQQPVAASGARHLAHVLRRLHRPAPQGAPPNPFRQDSLASRATRVHAETRQLAEEGRIATGSIATVEGIWTRALSVAVPDTAVWIHGDLHARNVLVDEGQLAGIIDWADLTAGDPATDLAAAWLVVDQPNDRATFLDTYGATETERTRAAGWALYVTLALLNSGEAEHEALGHTVLGRLLG